MHPALQSGPVGIYARFSSTLQTERSIEDQVRRCREFIAQAGGDAAKAHVFADRAISGASMERPGFEELMAAVTAGRIKAIVTEDMSRISRDFADSALIFKRLQFAQVPLLGVADGIDTSAKHAKLSFTVKSLVSDMYLDDLRDKTLRGLEGRALAGFATGNVAFGYHTLPAADGSGNRIAIHEGEAPIIRRIFEESRDGRSLATIAHGLNRDGIPSPRVGTRHTAFGWGASTIRAILYNERYAGVWRFKERQWVKVPGTNRRVPRPRAAAEVIVQPRPELAIIDASLWDAVQARLAATKAKYAQGGPKGGLTFKRAPYLLSGLLVCARCASPMTMHGGTSAPATTGARPTGARARGSARTGPRCARTSCGARCSRRSPSGSRAPRGSRTSARGSRRSWARWSSRWRPKLAERRARLGRAEDKMRGLVEFIASGDRTEYVVTTLRDLDAYAKEERAQIGALEAAAGEPLRLPSIDDVLAQVIDLDARLADDPEAGRARLGRWLKDSAIRVGPAATGEIVAEGELLPLVVIDESGSRALRGIPNQGIRVGSQS